MSSLSYRGSSRPLAGENRRTAGPVAALRAFGMMCWLDVKGSQGIFLLPVMVGFGLFGPVNLFEYEVVLWKTMNFASVQAYTFIAPLAAGLAAWTASRDRRRRMDGLIGSTSGSPALRDLSVFVATAGWGVFAHVIVTGCFAWLGMTQATWGGFNPGLVLTGTLGIVLAAAVGVLIGRHIPGRFAPILAVGIAYIAIFMSDVLGWAGIRIREPMLTPMELAWRNGRDDVLWTFPDGTHTGDGLLWLAGLVCAVVAVMFLVRRGSIFALAGLAASVAIAAEGVTPLLGVNEFQERIPAAYEPECRSTANVEVCVHPAYAARLPQNLAIIDAMVGPLTGLDGVRTTWAQGLGSTEMGLGSEDQQLYDLRGLSAARTVADELFPPNMSREADLARSEAQLAILYWLSERGGLGHPSTWDSAIRWNTTPQWPFGYPAGVPQIRLESEYSYWFEPDEAALAESRAEIDTAVDRFGALTADQQRAWLEANWDALRNGELTLDDLP